MNKLIRFLLDTLGINYSKILILLTILTLILSGSPYGLKRVGLIHHDQYQQLFDQQIIIKIKLQEYLAAPDSFSDATLEALKSDAIIHKRNVMNFVYSNIRSFLPLRLSKFVTMALIILFVVFTFINLYRTPVIDRSRIQHSFPKIVKDPVLVSLLIVVSLSSMLSLIRYGWPPIVSSIYTYSFFVIAISPAVFATHENLKLLSRLCFYSLFMLLLMGLVEVFMGLSIFSSGPIIERRIVGFLNQPNSLGIYAIVVVALFIALQEDDIHWLLLLLGISIGGTVIIFSGSNTAALVFLALNIFYIFKLMNNVTTVRAKSIILLSIIVISVLVVFLTLSERLAIESLLGRIVKYQFYFSQHHTLFDYVFGKGTGIGTNTLFSIRGYFPFENLDKFGIMFSVDSTPLLLTIQMGGLGMILFYWITIKALILDKQLRPVYIVFILCSLTINIIEVFPLNILLGLMLAKSFQQNTNSPPSIINYKSSLA